MHHHEGNVHCSYIKPDVLLSYKRSHIFYIPIHTYTNKSLVSVEYLLYHSRLLKSSGEFRTIRLVFWLKMPRRQTENRWENLHKVLYCWSGRITHRLKLGQSAVPSLLNVEWAVWMMGDILYHCAPSSELIVFFHLLTAVRMGKTYCSRKCHCQSFAALRSIRGLYIRVIEVEFVQKKYN